MKTILSLSLVLASLSGFAQSTEGVITYETRINMHRMLPPGQEDRKAMVPEFRTVKNQLFFNNDESIYKPLQEEEENEDGDRDRRPRQMQSEVYLKQSTGIMLTKQDFRFASKQYLVVDTVKVAPWKFGTDVKTVAGYECKQAYYTDADGKTVTAWYTDKLRAFIGPDQFNTLPGAILALDVNNGERVMVAKTVELRALKKGELQELTGGERISRAQFKKYMEEMRKRRQANGFRN
jgi:GLPGLI family protein